MVALPLKKRAGKSACLTTLTIIKRFEFESQLLRSGVLAVASAGSADEVLFFVKGAPASIEKLLGRRSVPHNYRQVCWVTFLADQKHPVASDLLQLCPFDGYSCNICLMVDVSSTGILATELKAYCCFQCQLLHDSVSGYRKSWAYAAYDCDLCVKAPMIKATRLMPINMRQCYMWLPR